MRVVMILRAVFVAAGTATFGLAAVAQGPDCNNPKNNFEKVLCRQVKNTAPTNPSGSDARNQQSPSMASPNSAQQPTEASPLTSQSAQASTVDPGQAAKLLAAAQGKMSLQAMRDARAYDGENSANAMAYCALVEKAAGVQEYARVVSAANDAGVQAPGGGGKFGSQAASDFVSSRLRDGSERNKVRGAIEKWVQICIAGDRAHPLYHYFYIPSPQQGVRGLVPTIRVASVDVAVLLPGGSQVVASEAANNMGALQVAVQSGTEQKQRDEAKAAADAAEKDARMASNLQTLVDYAKAKLSGPWSDCQKAEVKRIDDTVSALRQQASASPTRQQADTYKAKAEEWAAVRPFTPTSSCAVRVFWTLSTVANAANLNDAAQMVVKSDLTQSGQNSVASELRKTAPEFWGPVMSNRMVGIVMDELVQKGTALAKAGKLRG